MFPRAAARIEQRLMRYSFGHTPDDLLGNDATQGKASQRKALIYNVEHPSG